MSRRNGGPWRIVGIIGASLAALGVVLLLFTAYQLWGTGLAESHSQARLRQQIEPTLPRSPTPAATGTTVASSALPTGPPTTAPASQAPAEGQPVATISIPTIGLDQVVVEGVGTKDLQLGPGHYPGTPLPGQAGNVALAGHRTTYGHPFTHLDQLHPGDPIVLTTVQGVFDYVVRTSTTVLPTDVAVLDATTGPTLTLTTCTPPYSASHRLVVTADLAHSRLAGRATTPTTGGTSTATVPAPRPVSADVLSDPGGGSWVAALGWGLLVVLVVAGALVVARRTGRRLLSAVVAVPLLLVVLFVFFENLSPLLPASY